MSKITEKHAKDGLVVLAVNAWDEPREKVLDFVSKHKLKQRTLLNGFETAGNYNCNGVPTSFWIDREGVIVDIENGFGGPASLGRRTTSLLR